MSNRILLAVMNYHGANAVLLETAGAFAAEWASRLDVLFPHPPIWERDFVAISDESSRYRIQQIEEQAKLQEDETVEAGRKEFETLCARCGIRTATESGGEPPLAVWIPMRGTVRDTQVLSRARLADLVLVQRSHATSGENYDGLVSSILYESGRPVIVTPPSGAKTKRDKIAIAWNGGLESTRAVAAAMSLIGEAARVDIITAASDRTPETAAGNLADYLAGHGISATTHVLTKQWNRSVGETILEKCHEFGSDMLVMGAYARNRWREMVFGGVTRHILGHAELPVLMAH